MKKNEFIQIKGLDIKELRIKVKALTEEMANLVMDKNMKKLKDLKIISKKKKGLAQVLTVIRQKELLVELESIRSSQSSVIRHQTEKETDEKQKKPEKRKEKSDS